MPLHSGGQYSRTLAAEPITFHYTNKLSNLESQCSLYTYIHIHTYTYLISAILTDIQYGKIRYRNMQSVVMPNLLIFNNIYVNCITSYWRMHNLKII